MWQSREIAPFSSPALSDLVHNRVPAVLLCAFATDDETTAFANELQKKMEASNSVPEVTRLGISQYAHGIRESKTGYFSLARKARKHQQAVFSESFDPLQRLIHRLEEIGFSTAVMHEPDYGDYFAGSGKLREGLSPIHVDYAATDSDGWAVSKADQQLAWNLYLRTDGRNGRLQIWNKQWQPGDDEAYQVSDSYYYDPAVVEDAELLEVEVRQGDVLLINSRNYHAVTATSGRLAFGSFISVFDNNQLRLWS